MHHRTSNKQIHTAVFVHRVYTVITITRPIADSTTTDPRIVNMLTSHVGHAHYHHTFYQQQKASLLWIAEFFLCMQLLHKSGGEEFMKGLP